MRARYVRPIGLAAGVAAVSRGTCSAPLTSDALIRTVAETAF